MSRPFPDKRPNLLLLALHKVFLIAVLTLAPSADAVAEPIPLQPPIAFFTNVAAWLLKTNCGVDLDRIQVFPTNQYSVPVHLLLQFTANLYDCTTNRANWGRPYFPSVFRPVFTNDAGVIYLNSFVEETGTNVLGATIRDLSDPADRDALGPGDLVRGIPIINIPSALLGRLGEDALGAARGSTVDVQVRFTVPCDELWVIEASPDLEHWTALSTNTPSAGAIDLTVPRNEDKRFFRAHANR